MNCIFCKIGQGELPSFRLYDDDDVIALLDTNPVTPGHILVISRDHFDTIENAHDDVLERMIVVCKKMSEILKEKLHATGINILHATGEHAQQSVPHIHFHVIPRFENDGLDLWFHGKGKEANLEEVYRTLTE